MATSYRDMPNAWTNSDGWALDRQAMENHYREEAIYRSRAKRKKAECNNLEWMQGVATVWGVWLE